MENNLDIKEKRKALALEAKDILAGAAFPFMLSLILSATVMSFIAYGGGGDLGIQILILIAGEALLIAAIVIFGKQNGVAAYKKTVQNRQKRNAGSTDIRATAHVGEYAVYKSVIIAAVACVPFVAVKIIYAAYPNDVCRFMLMYVFGWGYYPFALAKLSPWLNLIMIIPFIAVHTAAYVWGGKTEQKKQSALEKQEIQRAEKHKK
ncbi:MAG: hypothetical protein K2L42_02580 [Clostridia bacterium]|nr:hypothetical protein [Clostridia bacterium]